jgi:uncharacterized membrane protein
MTSSTQQQTTLVRGADRSAVAGSSVRPLTPTEFNTAMVHLYRGEVGRANTWRMRLDGTTNWAVLTTGATLSFAFSSDKNTHVMILINSLLIMFFMFIEARRYRFYDLWRSRVRLIETEFFAEMLTPASQEAFENWRHILAQELLRPRFSVTMWEALGRRLRRIYIWIFVVLATSWLVKIVIHPRTTGSLNELIERARIGPIPPWVVLLVGVVFNAFLVVLAVTTAPRRAAGETTSREETRERIQSGEPEE